MSQLEGDYGPVGGSGDTTGAASSTDNAVVRWDGTTGKRLQNSVVTIADTTGVIAGTQGVTFSGATSGTVAVSAPAVAGTRTIAWPADSGDVALISQVITNGVTTKSPSEDAVFDALATKPTNGAANNVVPKSDGTNLVTSQISDDGGSIALGSGNIVSGTGEGSTRLGAGAAANVLISGANGDNKVHINEGLGGEIISAVSSNTTTFSAANILMPALPTSDPAVAGQLWRDGTTLKISTG